MSVGIYQIINKSNQRVYVGSSINLHDRRLTHFNSLRSGTHQNSFLQNDWNKCGEENFEFTIIESLPFDTNRKDLIGLEQQYLDKLFDNQNQCYNIRAKADYIPQTSRTISTREKISQAHTGRKRSAYECKRMSECRRGKKQDPAITAKRVASQKENHKLNGFSQAEKAAWCIPILKVDPLTDKVLKEYESITKAASEHNVTRVAISRCINGRCKTSAKFKWVTKPTIQII